MEPSGTKPVAATRILVVEDDRQIAELIAAYLGRDGIEVRIAASAEEGEACLASAAFDLVLLDLGLPGADGLEFLRRLRSGSTVPVIIVSARESDEDKVAGLGLGADDFVSKPFSPKVLAARVKAQLRRASYQAAGEGRPAGGLAGGLGSGDELLTFGPFRLDLAGRLLTRGDERIALSRREFELLSFLAAHCGRSYAPGELYREVWRLDHGDLSTVAVHVQRIRRKIEVEPSAPRFLRTVPGAGYRFVRDEKAP